MADLSQVLSAIQTAVATAVYPVAQAPGQGVVGFDVEVGVGWPDDSELDRALGAQHAYVAIYPLDGERNVTAWEYTDIPVQRQSPGISVVYDNTTNTAIFSGVSKVNDVIGVTYKRTGYYFAPNVGTTAPQLAQQIKAALPQGAATAVYGAVIFSNDPSAFAVASNNGLVQRYLGQIERRIQLSLWAFDQSSRDVLFTLLQQTVMAKRFLQIAVANTADFEDVSIVYSASVWSDKPQNAGGYMRSLIALVSWPITAYDLSFAIIFPNNSINDVQYYGANPPLADGVSSLNYGGVPLIYKGIPLTFTGE